MKNNSPRKDVLSINKRLPFLIEIFIGFLFIGIAIYICGRNFYSCNNNLYLDTTDAVPIYTKAKYAADCLRNMQWPSWFPNWYCGTSVSQYYPPLTYIILAPLEYFLQNTTLCLKIYTFLGLFIGGLGIWRFFYRYIGRFFGILAAILYVALPYFTVTFLFWGTVAQVPVIAIAPWYVICCIEFFEKPKKTTWLAIISLSFIMLLSHVMHGFMIALCVFVTLLVIAIIQKKGITNLLMWEVGTGLSAGILGFWWVTGVLPLENPGVPALAGDAAKSVTANLSWFFPNAEHLITTYFPDMVNSVQAYFPFMIILLSLISFFFIRCEEGKKKYVLIFLYIQTAFSFIFSFGSYLPFYNLIPLANKLVPGRILTQTAIGAVILSAYLISKLAFVAFGNLIKLNMPSVSTTKKVMTVALLIPILLITFKSYLNQHSYSVTDYPFETDLYSQLDTKTSNFEKGRLAWFGDNFASINTYLGYTSNYNMVSGWNIEGTSSAEYLRYQNSALSFEKTDYILKNIYDMNIQTCFVNNINFPWLCTALKENGFVKIGATQSTEILKRENWSYFMEQVRNSIVIGKASNIFLSDYPWFVKGNSSKPSDFNMDYLNKFDVIYYCDPQIDNIQQLETLEQQITHLSESGKTVFVEFGRTTFPTSILGVSPVSYPLEGKYYIESDDEFSDSEFYTEQNGGLIIQLLGLDDTLYKLRRDTGDFTIDFLGTKNIGAGKVYFIGGPLSQLKSFAFDYLTGNKNSNHSMNQRDKILNGIADKLFNALGIYKDLDLPAFEAQNIKWGANSCQFTSDSSTSKRVMASITYTPRWKVYIDNVETNVDQVDNMLTFDVPAGNHTIAMKYTMTVYGKIGVGFTVISLLIMIMILLLYNKVNALLNFCVNSVPEYLEIKN